MTRPPIDPPRLAARLKQEGMAAEQADALARALGDELGRPPDAKPGAGARSDLEDPVKRARLTTEIRMFKWVFGFAILATLTAFVALFESLDRIRVQQSRNNAQMAVLETRVKERFDAADARLDEQFGAIDERLDHQFGAIDKRLDHQFGAIDKRLDEQFGAIDRRLDHQFGAIDERLNHQFGAIDKRLDEQFGAIDKRLDEQFSAIDRQFRAVDRQFGAVDRQLDLIVQRIGSLEALLRETLSMQRGEAAAGAGGQVRSGPAVRAPAGVMR